MLDKKSKHQYWLGKKRLNLMGKPLSVEHRKKIGLANKGKKRSKDICQKLSLLRIGTRVGKLSSNWKGGVSKIDKLIRVMPEYYQWRSSCFERDNWTCMTCGIRGHYITVHHIKGINKIIREFNITNINEARNCKELWYVNNGITLCEDCHKLTDNYKGRAKKKLL